MLSCDEPSWRARGAGNFHKVSEIPKETGCDDVTWDKPGTSAHSVVRTRGVQSSLQVQGNQWGRATVGEDGAFWSMPGTQPDGEGGSRTTREASGGWGGLFPAALGPKVRVRP